MSESGNESEYNEHEDDQSDDLATITPRLGAGAETASALKSKLRQRDAEVGELQREVK
jgi:hypothetical protein